MKLFFTLFFFCCSSFAISQSMPSSCTPTAQMISTYRNDIIKSATVRLFETSSPYKDSISIPLLVTDTVAKALYAIHNMPQTALRDTLRNLFGFTNFNTALGPLYYEIDSMHIYHNGYVLGAFSPKKIRLYVPDTTSWAIQWQAGNFSNTTNGAINQLVLQYGLIITKGTTFNNTFSFICQSNSGINTFGLCKAFNTIIGNPPSGSGAMPFMYVGDGNSIELSYDTDGISVVYSNRCGDCPAGCTWGRRWTFKVFYGTCTVQYLGTVNYGEGTNPTNPALSVYTCTRGPVLPITFGTVTGYLQNGQPALSWKVLTQINVKEYSIERSDDGTRFYEVSKTPATAAIVADYYWKDSQALSGTVWFRIKAIDVDGKVNYSSVVRLAGNKTNGLTIYPNPIRNYQFTIQVTTPLYGTLQVGLYDLSGKKVWENTISLIPQTASRTISLPFNLPTGTYSMMAKNGLALYRQTVVISSK